MPFNTILQVIKCLFQLSFISWTHFAVTWKHITVNTCICQFLFFLKPNIEHGVGAHQLKK